MADIAINLSYNTRFFWLKCPGATASDKVTIDEYIGSRRSWSGKVTWVSSTGLAVIYLDNGKFPTPNEAVEPTNTNLPSTLGDVFLESVEVTITVGTGRVSPFKSLLIIPKAGIRMAMRTPGKRGARKSKKVSSRSTAKRSNAGSSAGGSKSTKALQGAKPKTATKTKVSPVKKAVKRTKPEGKK